MPQFAEGQRLGLHAAVQHPIAAARGDRPGHPAPPDADLPAAGEHAQLERGADPRLRGHGLPCSGEFLYQDFLYDDRALAYPADPAAAGAQRRRHRRGAPGAAEDRHRHPRHAELDARPRRGGRDVGLGAVEPRRRPCRTTPARRWPLGRLRDRPWLLRRRGPRGRRHRLARTGGHHRPQAPAAADRGPVRRLRPARAARCASGPRSGCGTPARPHTCGPTRPSRRSSTSPSARRAVDPEHLDGREPERRARRRRPEPAARRRGLPQARRAHGRRERRPAERADEPHPGQPLRDRSRVAGTRTAATSSATTSATRRPAPTSTPGACSPTRSTSPRRRGPRPATASWSTSTAPSSNHNHFEGGSTEPPLSVWQMLAEEGHPSIMVLPNARGGTYCYYGMAGADVFEAWADVAAALPAGPAPGAPDRLVHGRLRHLQARDPVPRPLQGDLPERRARDLLAPRGRRDARRPHRARPASATRSPACATSPCSRRPASTTRSSTSRSRTAAPAAWTPSAIATTSGTSRAPTPARATPSTASSSARSSAR